MNDPVRTGLNPPSGTGILPVNARSGQARGYTSDLFLRMGPGRAFIEGRVLEPVDRDRSCLVACDGKRFQVEFPDRPNLQIGQLIQAYGPFEPETADEYGFLTAEAYSAFPLGWMNGL